MHGLINRAIQRFAEDTHGTPVWAAAAEAARPGLSGFESMLDYDDALTQRVLDALAARTGLPREMLLEDLGTYLVRHPNAEAIRRLLRFGGETFPEFLLSLDDLPDRVGLAVPDLRLPPIAVQDLGPGQFLLTVGPGLPGFGQALAGVLRAMADDYGALALVVLHDCEGGTSRIAVTVAEAAFAEGRRFVLSALPAASAASAAPAAPAAPGAAGVADPAAAPVAGGAA